MGCHDTSAAHRGSMLLNTHSVATGTIVDSSQGLWDPRMCTSSWLDAGATPLEGMWSQGDAGWAMVVGCFYFVFPMN